MELPSGVNIDAAFGLIATACRDHWHANHAAAVHGGNPDGIHQFRVGLRRFRTALTLFRDYLPEGQRVWLKTEAKALADLLGPARDLDVFLNDLTQPLADRAASDPEVATILRTARAARDAAHARLAGVLGTKRYTRFMARLNIWLSGAAWTHGQRAAADGAGDAEAFARAILNRRLANIQKRAKELERATPEDLHALRIAIKKLRYGLEFFQSLLPPRRTARLGRLLKSLQDGLGHLNDLDVARRTVGNLAEEATDPGVRTAVGRVGARLDREFRPRASSALPQAVKAAQRLREQRLL